MRSLVRDAVGDHFGVDVVEAANGRDLMWTLLRTDYEHDTPPPQLVITDLAMPAYNGLEVLEAWRELHPSTPTILITAFPSEEVFRRAEQLGIAILAKPFSTAALRRLVTDVTDGGPR